MDSGNSTYVNVVNDLTLSTDFSVPAGVALIVKSGKTLTVNGGTTLDLTGGGLILENNATLTVDGTVNAKATTGLTSFGIGIMPGGSTSTTINGSGIIHLKTQGILLPIMAGQKLTLSGTVTLDGLTTETMYPGTSTAYPSGIGGDTMNNVGHVVFIAGELDMQGGTITGNYNTASHDGGGVEVNGEDNILAKFTMSGNAEVSGNRAANGGGGVRVNQGDYALTSFIMEGTTTVSGNTAGTYGGGVWVRDGGTFTLKGGTVYGSGAGDGANTASTSGASLYVQTGTAKWGDTSTSISGGTGGTTAGGNILNGGIGSTNDTLSATDGT